MTDDPLDFPAGSNDERELLLQWLGYLRGSVVRNLEGRDAHGAAAVRRGAGARPDRMRDGRPGDRLVQRDADQRLDGRLDAEAGQEVEASRSYHAVAVAASVMPCDSSQRSASIAALQPSAAAVTACR